jgi:hypothetical protein
MASTYKLEVKPRGADLVIGDRSGAGGRLHVKASDVDRGLSMQALTETLGPYEPPGEQARAEQPQADMPDRSGRGRSTKPFSVSGAAANELREQHLAYRRQLQKWYRQCFWQERLSGLSGVLRRQFSGDAKPRPRNGQLRPFG